ncbi:hypothetical protein J421_2307 [Gemmatirosa kalamazoonensis]|uniref:Uncharacterized protein n=1 Tax=Gemmatirosa kalamazoonensis TaxID=861299 RepID=W0RFI0_9BACT|nr:hypothetical protein [Gemmatirosa kalamazoonensis]AHG89844.1 hypothetical protein J421_2307 [Gemmatirosa kalamazoonensis]
MRTDPRQLDLFETTSPLPAHSLVSCGGASGRATHQPPWARSATTPRVGTGMYVTIPGGWDEPPNAECVACGRMGGGHAQGCLVADHEQRERACWEDAQLEAGDPALWADMIAATTDAVQCAQLPMPSA